MAVREINFSDVKGLVGQELGVSDWHEVSQQDVNAFADVTGDHQWIHIDPDRAKKESPYGTTIAHGYFTVSLIPYLSSQIWKVTGSKMGVNYGLNKLRFPAPVPVGKKVRARSTLRNVTDVEGGLQLEVTVQIEVEGGDKPAAVAETVSRIYG
jgi:acyl dehydratase